MQMHSNSNYPETKEIIYNNGSEALKIPRPLITTWSNQVMKDENLSTKKCITCNKEKQLSDFNYPRNECKKCKNIKNAAYRKTKKGLIASKYSCQIVTSRKRNHDKPDYTVDELQEWALNQDIFHKLFKSWEMSGYEKMLVPSFDRTDDYQGYSLDRLQIMTWQENKDKGHNDARNGINNKKSKSVIQFSKDGERITEHYSMYRACRVTGIIRENIRACCKGRRKTAGGFKWSYA